MIAAKKFLLGEEVNFHFLFYKAATETGLAFH